MVNPINDKVLGAGPRAGFRFLLSGIDTLECAYYLRAYEQSAIQIVASRSAAK